MINNLTASNVEEKAKELKGMLSEEFWDWFFSYIVIKRAAQEPNFQHLYEALIAALEVRQVTSLSCVPFDLACDSREKKILECRIHYELSSTPPPLEGRISS